MACNSCKGKKTSDKIEAIQKYAEASFLKRNRWLLVLLMIFFYPIIVCIMPFILIWVIYN